MYTLKLNVKKAFRSVIDNKTIHSEGTTLETSDIQRVNDLVSRGLAEIVSIEGTATDKKKEQGQGEGTKEKSPKPENPSKVTFRDGEYDLQSVKEAIVSLGITIAPNAGVNGVTKKLAELTDEQADALAEKLSDSE